MIVIFHYINQMQISDDGCVMAPFQLHRCLEEADIAVNSMCGI